MKWYCPSIGLAIAGPWLCVFGAVYLEKATVQPLTDYPWMGGDAFSDERLVFTSRLFAALRSAFSSLRRYYSSLPACATIDSPSRDGFPYIRQFGTDRFVYERRLAPDHLYKFIYQAKTQSGCSIVVKFVSKYNAIAHRLLAQQGMAPALLYAGTEDASPQTYGGQHMIVMDFVDAKSSSIASALSRDQFGQIQRAVELLHSHDLVFGDLRPPNILISKASEIVMLIDFDWCGKAGEARYPADLNEDEDIGWLISVGAGYLMEKEQDLFMLAKLRPDSSSTVQKSKASTKFYKLP